MTYSIPEYSPDLIPSARDRVIGVVGSKLLMEKTSLHPLFYYEDLASLPQKPVLTLHIAEWDGVPCFLQLYPAGLEYDEAVFSVNGLRSRLGILDDAIFMLAGRALQLGNWFSRHRFCGQCGTPTVLDTSERAMVCARCATFFYPQIAPCVMGLVTRDGQCLLAHNARFREGFYSVVAGFIEPGETAEQAVLREIREETGVIGVNPRYAASQPWPFPGQLMLGFIVDYQSGEINVDGKEITSAGWFDAGTLPEIPPRETLSGQLIQAFFGNGIIYGV